MSVDLLLPLELWRRILQCLGNNDHHSLLFVSHFFHLEAERFIYAKVIIFQKHTRLLEHLAVCARVAKLTRHLSFQTFLGQDESNGIRFDLATSLRFAERLHTALVLMLNLQSLEIDVGRTSIAYRNLNIAEVLKGVQFRLTRLKLNLHTTQRRALFSAEIDVLEEQQQITELQLFSLEKHPFSPSAFPHLRMLRASGDISTLLASPDRSHVRALSWKCQSDDRPFPALSSAYDSVNSLKVRLPLDAIGIGLKRLPRWFPSLQYLCVFHLFDSNEASAKQTVLELASGFPILRKLVIQNTFFLDDLNFTEEVRRRAHIDVLQIGKRAWSLDGTEVAVQDASVEWKWDGWIL